MVRATGVAVYMDNSPWPSRCVVPAKNQQGQLSLKSYGVQYGMGPPILVNPKGLQIYRWMWAKAYQNLWKCGDSVGPPPNPLTCPFVVANYPESWITGLPIRRYCRFSYNNQWAYGWSDARYDNTGRLLDDICYAVANPAASTLGGMRIVTSSTYQMLGFIQSFLDVASRGG